jgi:hypothetical protein
MQQQHCNGEGTLETLRLFMHLGCSCRSSTSSSIATVRREWVG